MEAYCGVSGWGKAKVRIEERAVRLSAVLWTERYARIREVERSATRVSNWKGPWTPAV